MRIFLSADCKFRERKKKCLYYRKQQVKRCYDKQLVHITVILRSKHIFSSREIFKRYNFWIRIWLTFLCPKFWPFNTGLTVHIRSMSSSTLLKVITERYMIKKIIIVWKKGDHVSEYLWVFVGFFFCESICWRFCLIWKTFVTNILHFRVAHFSIARHILDMTFYNQYQPAVTYLGVVVFSDVKLNYCKLI